MHSFASKTRGSAPPCGARHAPCAPPACPVRPISQPTLGGGRVRCSAASPHAAQADDAASVPRGGEASSSDSSAAAKINSGDRFIRSETWPNKASLYLLRTDGRSCSRELVSGTNRLTFAYPSTQQHMMVWRHRPRSVMVLKKLGDELLPHFMHVVSHLTLNEGLHVVVEPDTLHHFSGHPEVAEHVYTWDEDQLEHLAEHVDFVVCLGGDGVLLHASALFQKTVPPVIAFNLGSLGFLTNHSYTEFMQDLQSIIHGQTSLDTCDMPRAEADGNCLGVMVTLRMRLKCELLRRGQSEPEQTIECMNEMVIDRGPNAFLTNIECYEKGRFVTRVQADGIMLSTPTGSTAYSVSAGGSMVHPNVPAILLTPVCPHSLSFRPIVLPDYADIEFRIPDDARNTAWVSFDGRSRQQLRHGDRVRVRMSDSPVPTINKEDLTTDWFDSLERCFKWTDRAEQKALELHPHQALPPVTPPLTPPKPLHRCEAPMAAHCGGMPCDVPAEDSAGSQARSNGARAAPSVVHANANSQA